MNKKIAIASVIFSIAIILIIIFVLTLNGSDNGDNIPGDQNRVPTSTSRLDNNNQLSPTESPPELDYSEYVDLEDQTRDSQLENAPDAFLYNELPHEEDDFIMTGTFASDDSGEIVFTVASKSTTTLAQQAAETWMLSIGLTQEKIDTLTIVYE